MNATQSLMMLVLVAAAPPPKDSAADKFRRDWGEIVDPLKDCTLAAGPAQLKIKIPGTPHPFTPTAEAPSKAPRVRREIAGDFDARVKVVSVTLPTENSGGTMMTSGGLYLGTDDNTYITISRYSTWGRNGLGAATQFLSNQRPIGDGVTGSELKDAPAGADAKPAYVRLVREGNKVTAYTSMDGETWTVHVARSHTWPDKVSLGVFASHGTNLAVEGVFEEFTVTQPAKDKGK